MDKIQKDDRIVIHGCNFLRPLADRNQNVLCLVNTAINYGHADQPVWYIEATTVAHDQYVYWKQDIDGGTVYKVDPFTQEDADFLSVVHRCAAAMRKINDAAQSLASVAIINVDDLRSQLHQAGQELYQQMTRLIERKGFPHPFDQWKEYCCPACGTVYDNLEDMKEDFLSTDDDLALKFHLTTKSCPNCEDFSIVL